MTAATAERPAPRVTAPAARSTMSTANLAAVLGPCVLAAALVFLELGTRSLWLDEGATIAISTQHGSALSSAIAHDGGNMLGYYLFQHAFIGLFGHAPAVIRTPSAIATIVTVGLVGALGLRLFDRRVALAAGLLAAVSLPLVLWGQDARAYAPMMGFICVSFLALTYAVESPARRWPWIAWGVSLVLATYMSFIAVLVIPGALAAVFAHRRAAWRPALVALAGVLVLGAPIAVLAADRGSGQLFWVPSPTLARVDEMLRWVTSSGMPPNVHRSVIGAILLGLSLVALIAIVVRTLRHPTWAMSLLSGWLLAPLALVLLESIVAHPIALARTSLVALPAASLLLAGGLLGPDRAARLPVRASVAWGAVAVIVTLRALVLAPTYGSSPENWHAASAHVSANARPGDCVAFYPVDGWMVFDAYAGRGALPASVLPATTWGPGRPYVERYVIPSPDRLSAIAHRCTRLWLVASHEGRRDGPPAARTNLARFRGLEASLRRLYGSASGQSRFGWAAPVRVRLYAR